MLIYRQAVTVVSMLAGQRGGRAAASEGDDGTSMTLIGNVDPVLAPTLTPLSMYLRNCRRKDRSKHPLPR